MGYYFPIVSVVLMLMFRIIDSSFLSVVLYISDCLCLCIGVRIAVNLYVDLAVIVAVSVGF